jgi:AcrR family transcriptional regulator
VSTGLSPPSRQRQRILRRAARVFAEHGYHGTSVRDLAAAVGCSPSSLYNYFPGKEDILHALQTEAFETLIDAAETALAPERDAVARLYVFIAHHLRYVADNPHVMRVLVHEASSLPRTRRQTIRRSKERYFELGRSVLAEILAAGCLDAPGRDDVDPRELERLTYALFGALNWVYGWYDADLHGEPQELARTIHRLVLCGVVARCPHRLLQDRLDGALAAAAPYSLIPLRGASA